MRQGAKSIFFLYITHTKRAHSQYNHDIVQMGGKATFGVLHNVLDYGKEQSYIDQLSWNSCPWISSFMCFLLVGCALPIYK